MNINIQKSLSIPFSSSDWPKKLGIASLFYLANSILLVIIGNNTLYSVLSGLISLFPIGYIGMSIHNELKNNPVILPEWNFKESFKKGAFIWLIMTSYILAFIPLYILLAFLSRNIPAVFFLLLIPSVFVIFVTLAIAYNSYVENFDFKKAYDFPRIFKFFKIGIINFLKAFGWSMLFGVAAVFVSGFISGILSNILGQAAGFFIGSVLFSFIYSLIYLDIFAQAYEEVILKQETQNTEVINK